jgi:hypothetical protein
MTHIEFSPNFGTDIDLPPEYEHIHEFPADPQSFWDAIRPIMLKFVEPAFAGWGELLFRFWSDSAIIINKLCWI